MEELLAVHQLLEESMVFLEDLALCGLDPAMLASMIEDDEEDLDDAICIAISGTEPTLFGNPPDWETVTDVYAIHHFRFTVNEALLLCDVFRLPPVVQTAERYTMTPLDAMLILLRRLSSE
jgi:hypothetical protein